MSAFLRMVLFGFALAASAAHAVPTLSVTPAAMGPGGPITASWAGVTSPTAVDWIGLYAVGAPDSAFLLKQFTTGAGSGSVPLTLPNPQAFGTYELRLFSNNTFTRLATSNSLSIGPGIMGFVRLNGITPLSNVPLSGATGGICFSSDPLGQYGCAVSVGWSGTLTPQLAGYTFTPASRTYSNVTENQLGFDFAATYSSPPQVTLSVTPLSMGPGGTVTATWSGIAVPQGTDWIGLFTPGQANHLYFARRNTTGAGGGSVTFTLPSPQALGTYELRLFSANTFTLLAVSNSFSIGPGIFGTVTLNGAPLVNIPIAGATDGICFPTDTAGGYGCAVSNGWSGSLSPKLAGYYFTPESRAFTNVTVNTTGQSFTAAAGLQITGALTVGGAGLAGITLTGPGGVSCIASNAAGQYTCTVPSGWSGSLTPTLAGHSFSPASRTYANVTANRPGESYAATILRQVSGTVTVGGSPLAGVSFSATNGGACTTSNGSGQYTCTVPQGWSGSLTPSNPDTVFVPASRSYTNVTSSQLTQDYAASISYTLSGSITLNGLALPDVAVGGPGVSCSPTNASGQYTCIVPLGWTGPLTPSANGYSFAPASRDYTSVSAHQPAQGFAATLDTATAPIYFVHVDHLNTPRLVANATGQTMWRWGQGEPYGVNVPDENPSGLSTFEFPLRLPGQYADKETNISYNFWRDYDPSIGRYVQSDIVGLASGLNTYLYANADPMTYLDRDGLYPARDNGNRNDGHTQQDMVCTLPGPLGRAANANRCVRECCIAHDNCYTHYKCNESSWRGKFWTQCMQCNLEAALCIANALTKSRQMCGVCDD